jgi:hypothetical protein
MSGLEASRIIGKSESYFASTKISNKRLYRTFKYLGRGNLARGYIEFHSKCTQLKMGIIESIHQWFSDYEFSVWLLNHGFYTNRVSAYHFASISVYGNDTVKYPQYLKLRKMKKLLKKEQKWAMK